MSALAAASPQTDVGGPEAFAAALYERHRRAIFGFCYKQLRRREDADDAVQTTFIYALTSLRRGVVPELELPWLFTIARNVCSTRRRSGMRRGAYESAQDLDSVQDMLASPERSDVATTEDFTAALRAIPENQRMALLLREWCGLSYEEIGAQLGLSQSATEALLFRARQNAAQRLGERTGLSAALQGLPFLSFLRNLFQSAAAKTLAVGAGAALTIAAVPAANEHPLEAPASKASPAVVQTAPRPALEPNTSAPSRTMRSTPQSQRSDAGARSPVHGVVRSHHQGTPVVPQAPTPDAVVNAPPAHSDVSAPAPATQPPTVPQQLSQPLDNVVDTASQVSESLPPVSLPQVQTPAITVPVTQTLSVTVPAVHLP
jgi:RNA polymerase sigma-70 factor (ECF subfamily)